MASLLNILLTILIAASFVQIFVVGQTVDEETDNDDELTTSESSYLRKLLNVLSHWPYVKQEASSEDVDVSDSAEYISEENRPSRNLHVREPSQLCEMSRHLIQLPHDEYEYRPSFYYEVTCAQHDSRKSVYGLTAQPDKKFCYNNRGCQAESQEITIFRRLRNGGSCWEPRARKITVGCKCKFPHQRLPSLVYTP